MPLNCTFTTKYFTNRNTRAVIDHIYTIYEPLQQALQTHGALKADITIISIVVSRTGKFNGKTLAEIAHMVYFNEEPLDARTYTQLPKLVQNKAMYMRKIGSLTYQKSQEKSSPQKRNPILSQ
jgi:hypothetical protein